MPNHTPNEPQVVAEYGRMIDCRLQGCDPPHSDDGEPLPWPTKEFGEPDFSRDATVNGHACRWVTRSIAYGPWVEAAVMDSTRGSDKRPSWERALNDIEDGCKVRNRAIDAARRLCQSLHVTPTKNGGVTISMASEDVSIELTDEGQLEDFYLSVTDVNHWLRPKEEG